MKHTSNRVAASRGSAACAIACALLISTPATAAPYESFIDVETEEDLADLVAEGVISSETYESLAELLARGIDINRASRDELYSLPNLSYVDVDAILEYRKIKGRITSLAELATAGVLDERTVLSVSAFLLIGEGSLLDELRGHVVARTRGTPDDRTAPPVMVRGRVMLGDAWTVGGAALTTRYRLGDVRYDPARDALSAEPAGLQAHLPKFYARYQNGGFTAVLGTYGVGFGQRLVFDTTNDYTPAGIVVDDRIDSLDELSLECRRSDGERPKECERSDTQRVTPDFRWRESLTGAAATYELPKLGNATLSLTGWASFQRRRVYQYDLYRPDQCNDPRRDDEACGSPDVYVTRSSVLAPTDRTRYATLPNVFGDWVGGANVTLAASRRHYVMATGYAVATSPLIEGIELDYQESSGRPHGGGYGAAGLAGGTGVGAWDVGAEVAMSIDNMAPRVGDAAGGGGPAAIVRGTYTQKRQLLEATLRYYDVNFANPYGRPIADSDEFEGLRARDEAGAQLRYRAKHGRLVIDALGDLWTTPTNDLKKARAFLHSDLRIDAWWQLGVWLDYKNQNLTSLSGIACVALIDDNGDAISCDVQEVRTALRAKFTPNKKLALFAQAQHKLAKASNEAEDRNDLSAWLRAVVRPSASWNVRARLRWLSESFDDNTTDEDSLDGAVDVGFRSRPGEWWRLRTSMYWLTDKRASTADRTPNPEVSLWLTYDHRFR